ncbi:MAG: ABC transporter permease [Thermomicrobiales bacterium]|nr:ABC transporter permease [Thermomicrobiales bacterium]
MRRFARMAPLGAIAAVFLLVLILIALFAPQLAPYDPIQTDYAATQQAPTRQHLLGTDHLGRDVLSRIIFGARVTLLVSLASVVLAVAIGLIWGVVSAYAGNRVDMISQRMLEVLMSFPALILAMLLMVSLGSGLPTLVIAIGIAQVPLATRITRSVVLTVKERAFVEAARCGGATSGRIMLRHVTPQCVAPMLVVATVNLGAAIFAEAALSFLGVGVPPPTPSWGSMLGGVLAQSFNPPWWLVLFPGLAIASTVMAANLFGDGLRDFLDPRVRQR